MDRGAKDISGLSHEQRALLEQRLQRRRTATPSNATIPRRAATLTAPLSFAQERLWFLSQLQPESPLYNIPAAFRLIGVLDIAALDQTFAEIVRRHEVLRTTIAQGTPASQGQPIQVIAPTLRLPLDVIDLEALPEAERMPEAERRVVAAAQQPFDLATGPLIRTQLLRLAEHEHVLLLTLHHIVSDGWSTGILRHEIATLYAALQQGRSAALPELPIQYADYAIWQRGWLQGEILARQLAYWRQELADVAVLQLPTDRPRSAIQSHRGALLPFDLSPEVTTAVKRCASQAGTTLFMTLLAAFNVLLSRYSDQTDIAVGTPIANRTRPELEPLLGFFVNTLVLRSDLSGNPRFCDVLAQVRERALNAYSHQDLPFERLVEELQPSRDLSYTPLFQVMFIFQTTRVETLRIPDLTLSRIPGHSGTALFDLTLEMVEADDRLCGQIEYNTDLFDAATITRMIAHFQCLVAGSVADPAQRIGYLPLSKPELSIPLLERQDARISRQAEHDIVHVFEEQAAQRPQALAVVGVGEQVSYQELNQRSNQLAHHLRELGVGPEVIVGLCVEPSVALLVALLGILKAGGAYLPLDPAYPTERLARILDDARPLACITQAALAAALPDQRGQTICLDTDWPTIERAPTTNPARPPFADRLAYLIYTSGSTGRPKGVAVQQQSLLDYTLAAQASYAIQPTDRVLLFSSINWDTSVEEIFPCLTRGATLVLRTAEMTSSSSAFLSACQAWSVTVINLPTAFWHELVASLSTGMVNLPERLRLVIFGGEKALATRVMQWRQAVDARVRLLNEYGATETTAVTTIAELSDDMTMQTLPQEVPIGDSLPHVRVYLLDQWLQPVPVGVPGECYVGGSGIARGYVGQPELTAERFIPDPFSADYHAHDTPGAGARLYKTGDLMRYRADGTLEHLGRADQQVKVRGFRIELSEIEAALQRHPAVEAAVAIVHEDPLGAKRLIAYVVPRLPGTLAAGELRRFVREQLPDYMTPAACVVLESLPLNANGKVDRQRLPAHQAQREVDTPFIAPHSEIERTIAAIWAEVLHLEQVGVHDNFFDLGGHSLSLVKMHTQLQHTLHVDVPLIKVYKHPTVRALAEYVAQDQPEQTVVHPNEDRITRQRRAILQQQQRAKKRR